MFEDRVDAGVRLCQKLSIYSERMNFIVVGLLRGGLIPAKVISDKLNLKLFPLMVKKIPTPNNSELALGAMISPKETYLNNDLIKDLKISDLELNKIIIQKWIELRFIRSKYKINKKEFKNKNVLLVDDGVATGATVLVSQEYLRKNGARDIILATPVIATDTFNIVKKHFDAIIYLIKVKDFNSVGQFYKNFNQVADKEIEQILNI